jgi:hypothetical protein
VWQLDSRLRGTDGTTTARRHNGEELTAFLPALLAWQLHILFLAASRSFWKSESEHAA